MKKGRGCMVMGILLAVCACLFHGIAVSADTSGTGCWIKDNGPNEVLMGNELVKLRMVPARGGICSSLVYHGKEFTIDAEGLFQDLLVGDEVYGRGNYEDAKYSYRIIKNTPEEVSLHLWAKGKTGIASFIVMNKTISLFKGSPAIKADYELLNHRDSMMDLSYGLRVHNVLGVQGEKNDYYLAASQGAVKIIPPPNKNFYEYGITRGWEAALSASGMGAAFLFEPYGKLDCLYNCFLDHYTTVEPFCYKLPVACGESFKAAVWIIPFSGLKQVDEITSNLIAGVTIPKPSCLNVKSPIKIELFSYADHPQAVIDTSYSILPGESWIRIGKKSLALKSNSVKETVFHPVFSKEGTYLIKTIVKEGDKVLLSHIKKLVIGKSSGSYVQLPLEKRMQPEKKIKKETAQVKDFMPTMSFETPHIKWAKPYKGGKLKVLFFTDCLASGQREVIELAQRMDIDFISPALTHPKSSWKMRQLANGSITEANVRENLWRAIKQPYDVIVMVAPLWDALDENQHKEIIKRVSKGTGLIVIEPGPKIKAGGLWEMLPVGLTGRIQIKHTSWRTSNPHYLTTGIPFELLPPTKHMACQAKQGGEILAKVGNYPLLVTGGYGKGKVVCFNYGAVEHGFWRAANITPFLHTNPCWESDFEYWEYWYSLLAKAVLWSADRQPSVLIKSIVMPDSEIYAENSEKVSVKLELLNNGNISESVNISMLLRYEGAKSEGTVTERASIEPGQSSFIELRLPAGLKDGLYLADIMIRDKQSDKVINWGSIHFNVRSKFRIKGIAFEKEIFSKGEEIKGTISMECDSVETTKSSKLQLTLFDTYNRQLDTVNLEIGRGKSSPVKFHLKSGRTESVLNNLVVKLITGDKVRQVCKKTFSIVPKEIDFGNDYEIGCWSAIGEWRAYYLRPFSFGLWKKMGLTFIGTSWEHHRNAMYRSVAENNFKLVCNNTWYSGFSGAGAQKLINAYRKSKDKHTLVRPHCFNNAANETKREESLAKRIREKWLKYAPAAYLSGDEQSLIGSNSPVDLCFSKHCMAKMRQWLKEEYGDLPGLNKGWGTDFNTWDEVEPMTKEEVRTRKDRNFSPWADHRAFMDITWAGNLSRFERAVKSVDGRGIIGYSGTRPPHSYGGWNFSIVLNPVGIIFEYCHEDLQEYQRSFARPGTMRGSWMGYGCSGPALNYKIWQNTIHGDNLIPLFLEIGFHNPDLTMGKRGKQFIEHSKDLREGLGKQLMHCKRKNNGIAVYYSHPSMRATYISGYGVQLQGTMGNYFQALEEMQLQYDLISHLDLESGKLKNFKILIMPFTMALSEKEAKIIKEFVSGGGVVLADIQTGIMDEHCKLFPCPLLDDLFGIDRTGTKLIQDSRKITFDKNYIQLQGNDNYLNCSSFENDIKLRTAKEMAKTDKKEPVFLINKFGKGKAVYLGCDIISRYRLLRKFKGTAGMKEKVVRIEDCMREVLKMAGVQNKFEILRDNEPLPFCEAAVFKSGEMELLCIIRDYGLLKEKKPEEVIIKFKDKSNIYDARTKRYLGFTDSIKTNLEPDGGKLLALLPYRIESIDLSLDKKSYKKGEEVNYKIRLSTDGKAKKAENHVVSLNVYDPKGNLIGHYSKQILTHGGKGKGSFILALNDSGGAWAVEIKEVITGKTCRRKFIVLPK